MDIKKQKQLNQEPIEKSTIKGDNLNLPSQKEINQSFQRKNKKKRINLPFQKNNNFANPLWISVSEAAKLGGISARTVRRSLEAKQVRYKIVKNRYLIDFTSLIIFLHSKKKLFNKLSRLGLGQYIKKWLD
jgi:hypothetical protein